MPGHILAAFEFGSVNGGENSFLAVVDLLREQGWHFSALAPPDSPLSQKLIDNHFSIIPFERNGDDGTRLDQPALRTAAAETIQEVRPNLVHCNSLSMSRLLGPVCRQLKFPSLGYLRDIIKISRKAMDDINQLDKIVAVSEATRAFHVQHGLAADRSITIHNGIDRNAFLNPRTPTVSIREQLALPDNSRLLLSCGQIGMRKGLDTLIESFIELNSLEPNRDSPLHLLIVGQRHSQKQEAIEYESQLHARVADAQLTSQVHFLGRRSDVAQLMQQATLLIHTARQEPLGRVLLEAASVGLPIVATDVGGTAEILSRPSLKDCLVRPNNPSATARTAKCLLQDKDRLSRLSQELREHAATHFSINACAMALNFQYKSLTDAIDFG